MRRQLTTNRRLVFGTFVAAILALAVGASQGLAGARGNGSAKAPIQYHGGSCGVDTGSKSVGTASFTLKGSTLTIRVKLHGADPGTYRLFVDTGACEFIGSFSLFKVDASGDGEKSVSIDVSGFGRSFFVNAFNNTNGHANDSLIVNL